MVPFSVPWDRWLGGAAAVVGLPAGLGYFFGPTIAYTVLLALIATIAIERFHVAYGRPFAPRPYKPPVYTLEQWARVMDEYHARPAAFFLHRFPRRNRRRRSRWRRHSALALPRPNESYKPRYGVRTAEPRRTPRFAGCLPRV